MRIRIKRKQNLTYAYRQRPIEDFPDYEVTSDGRIYSKKRNKFLKPHDDGRGYLSVGFKKNGKSYRKSIHRLVALAFIPKTEEDIRLNRNCVDHIDGNKSNNNVNNLRWCTVKENNSFPLVREKQRQAGKERAKGNQNACKPIIIDGIEYKSAVEADRILGINRKLIHKRLKNPNFKNYQYKGGI